MKGKTLSRLAFRRVARLWMLYLIQTYPFRDIGMTVCIQALREVSQNLYFKYEKRW